MKLTFRMNTPDDKQGLIDLWTGEAEWDQIDETVWNHRFGKADIALAIDEETTKIVGQIIFIPTPVSINGQEVKSYRPFAIFLTKAARSFQSLNPFNHPAFKLYKVATDEFRKKGVSLIQMLPDPLWGRMFQLAPNFQFAKFPLMSLKLPFSEPFALGNDYKSVEILPTDKRLDELWEKSAEFYGCSTVRNSEMLAWKTSHHQYFYLGLERNGELVGFSSSRFKSRDRQWLICDVLAADSAAFEVMIKASCNQADEFKQNNPVETLDKVAILATEKMLLPLEKMDFYRDKYNFLFVVHILDESLKSDLVAPSKWYVAAND
jgi:hypothetical protein